MMKYDGTVVKIEKIKKGDKLMGADHLPKEVTSISRGRRVVYEITPLNGLKYCVGGDHMLSLKYSNVEYAVLSKESTYYRIRGKYTTLIDGIPIIKTTSQRVESNDKTLVDEAKKAALVNLTKMPGRLSHGSTIDISVENYCKLKPDLKSAFKWYRSGVEFKCQNVPIDPYLLGMWLGDGTSCNANITTADNEIVDEIGKIVKNYGLIFKKIGAKYRYNVIVEGGAKKGQNKFLNFLKEYNLLNNKHIPDIYQYNSRENRLKLLAGLIDSDGYYDKGKNMYSFTMSNKYMSLIDGMIHLIRSLGFSTYKYYKQAVCTNGKNGPVKTDCSNFNFSGYGQEDIPCILPRKQAKKKEDGKSNMVTGIEVKKLASRNICYNIELADKGKIIFGDFSVGYC
jgi:intein/homing endonuclease